MKLHRLTVLAVGFFAINAAAAVAETSISTVAFSTADQVPTPEQPANGGSVSYGFDLAGGTLDACRATVKETLYGRDGESWGAFEIDGAIACADGGFSYVSSGAWEGEDFAGGGKVVEGSGTGRFASLTGPVAQLGGKVLPAEGGQYTISFRFVLAGE